MKARRSSALVMALVLARCAICGCVLSGCNSEPTKLDQMAEAAATPPASSVPKEPTPRPAPTPVAPAITVDDAACSINGEEVLFMNADARDRIAAMLADKPLVQGNVVAFDAARDAKTPRVAAVVSALRKAKAMGAAIHTPMRDNSKGELLVRFAHGAVSECTPVAMITRDGSIAVWSAAGSTAQKFARGFAGPDLTLATEGLRRASAACGSAVWVLGADDNIGWGLTFDLAMRARGDGDSGSGLRATETVLAREAPVAGRKVVVP
jgi:hypothetical protein